jgi:hypothetical protein
MEAAVEKGKREIGLVAKAQARRNAFQITRLRNYLIINSHSWVFRFWPRIVFHGRGPLQKPNQLAALVPEEAPEFEESDFVHLETGVGLDAPS